MRQHFLTRIFSSADKTKLDASPTWFDNVAAVLADTETYTAGTEIWTRDGHKYRAVASSGSLGQTNAGGQELDVIPDADGCYVDVAFGVAAGDSTSELQAAIAAMVADGRVLKVTTSCTITSAVGYSSAVAQANMLLHIVGDVTWTVSSAGQDHTLIIESTAAGNCIITGGSLTVECANKAASGIWYRHYASSDGIVKITAKLKINDVKQLNGSETLATAGLFIYGEFLDVHIVGASVDGVDRVNAGGGECTGILVSQAVGTVVIDDCKAARVLTPGADADGIKVFLKEVLSRRPGQIRINNPVCEDNQGRHIKAQGEDVVVTNPIFIRKSVVTISNSVDVSFQEGGGVLINPQFDYQKDGATSPLGSGHTPVNFQPKYDAVQIGKSIGGVMRTDVAIDRYALVGYSTAAGDCDHVVEGLTVIATGDLKTAGTTAFTRAILEVENMDDLLTRAEPTSIAVRDCHGPFGCAPIGYTNYTTGGSPGTYLSWDISRVENTIAAAAGKPFNELSGNPVLAFKRFLLRANHNVPTFFGNALAWNAQTLVPGCAFYASISANSISNGPTFAGSGYAFVECVDSSSNMGSRATDRFIRIYEVGQATVHITHNGGTSWTSIVSA